MKVVLHKISVLTLAALIGLSVATPADARWYDGHGWHGGHAPRGWVWDPRLHYYVAGPGVVVGPPVAVMAPPVAPAVVIAQPAPPPLIVERPVYAAPAPGLSLGINIR